jgi:hypothetical protein
MWPATKTKKKRLRADSSSLVFGSVRPLAPYKEGFDETNGKEEDDGCKGPKMRTRKLQKIAQNDQKIRLLSDYVMVIFPQNLFEFTGPLSPQKAGARDGKEEKRSRKD